MRRALFTAALAARGFAAAAPPAVPSAAQLTALTHTFTAFHHFSLCSMGVDGGCQWDSAVLPPAAFDPPALDTDQWLATDALMGATQACLTVRHVDGFALWPTASTNYSVAASPWRGGAGDVVADFVASARKFGVSPCFYIILGFNFEANRSGVPGPAYLAQQVTALTELLTRYGKIDRLWWDNYAIGCCQPVWAEGFFCPPGGTTATPSAACPAWQTLIDTVRAVSPGTAMIPGPDGCLVNGESFGGTYPVWHASPVAESSYSCRGDVTQASGGGTFLLRESDFTMLEPGDNWFWQPNKPFLNASEIMAQFVAKHEQGASLILNVAPNSTGVIPDEYVAELRKFAAARAATFGAPVAALAAPVSAACEALSFVVPVNGTFDTVLSVEDMRAGQVVAAYSVEARDAATGAWAPLRVHGASVGSRVLDTVGTQVGKDALRFNCTASLTPPAPVVFTNEAGACLGPPAGAAFPCWEGQAAPGGEVFHLCPLVAAPCGPASAWTRGAASAWASAAAPGALLNVDCDSCAAGAHAKIILEAGSTTTYDAAARRIRVDACPGMCLTNGVAPGARASCAGNETWYATQVHVDACDAASTASWTLADAAPAAPATIAAFGAYLSVPVAP